MRKRSEEDLLLSSTEKKGTKRKRSIIDVEIRIKIYWPKLPTEKPTNVNVRKKIFHIRKLPRINFDDQEYFFKNHDDKWLIVQLNETVMLEDSHHQVENSIIQAFGSETPYYIPVYWEKIQDKEVAYVLCDGYVFITETQAVLDSIQKLRNEFMAGPLKFCGRYQTVTTKEVNKFKTDIRNKIHAMLPLKGDKVRPKVGAFKNLEGKVVSVDSQNLTAMVRFIKSSRVVEAPQYVLNLEKVEEV